VTFEPARRSENAQPSGTVTFLFTDIEGSTQRWERDGTAMRDAVRRHDALLRSAFVEHGGHVFKTVGDAFCVAFSRPEFAVAASLTAQRALSVEDFSAVDGLRVRAAIHTGTADERDGDYFGAAVNRVARLLAIGHGGQVLVSGVTVDLVQGALPARSSLRDLGQHRLKDLTHPEQVYQLVAEGLVEVFPPVRSLESLPNNLPLALTSFVGREEEVAEIAQLVGTTRLLTLVGTGGVGKTRAALQVAAELLDGSGDGVWFVDLAPIRDPALVAHEVVLALGLTVPPDKTALQIILEYLKPRRLLLVVDNCEHLVASAAAALDAILRGCPKVTILATSREGLNVSGEHVHRMPSLAVPPRDIALSAATAATYGAVALFAERAHAADGRFALTDENAEIVAEVCRRLDGIALAIELAAPRVKVLAVEQLSRRLDERFRILTGGSRNALPRQQTMRALIDWSYDLLSDQEKVVLRRAGVFVGGFTLEAAAAICNAETSLDEWEVLEILSTLVDKSLVSAEIQGSHQRYRLLESMREYARTRLVELDELENASRAHAAYFLEYAKLKREAWDVTPGAQWIEPMLPELDNFRATFEWLLEHDPVSAAEFSAVIHRFFDRLAMQDEELRWIDRVFEANRELPARIEGEVLDARMTLLINQGRPQGAVEAARRVLEIARASGSEAEIVSALIALSLPLTTESNKDEVAAIAREAVERANALGDELEISRANAALASTELLSPAERRRMLAESIATQRRLGRNRHAALTMMRLSLVELRDGEPEAAVRVAAPLVELCRSIEPTLLVRSLGMLSAALAKAGDVAGALSAAREQLERAAAIRKPFDCRSAVCVLVALQEEVRDPVLHAKLLGYVRGDLAAFQDAWWREVFAMREAAIKRVEAMIGRERFEEYALEGATWSEETVHRESLKL
jgi:predicted ATPase/class 3 adenylate cyclase